MTSGGILLLASPLVPLVAALLLVPAPLRPWILRWAPLAALPAVLLAFLGAPGMLLNAQATLLVGSFELDATGQVFLGFSAVLWMLAHWFAQGTLGDTSDAVRFNAFFLLSMAGNIALILAADIPTFYSGYALMGLASAGLVVHRGDDAARRAGRIYLGLAVVGEVLLFLAFGLLAFNAASLRIADVAPYAQDSLTLALLLIGFGIKAGALTVHFWLPLAHPAAPVPASAVLSGAMIKAGLLGWIRFLPFGHAALPAVGATFIASGLSLALLATVAGVTQRNPKTVLAYSSLSQMGVISVALGVALIQPTAWPEVLTTVVMYALHHGLSKGALFLSVTPVAHATTRAQIWWVRFGLLIPAFALAGAPFTSGAVAKLTLKSNLGYLPDPWGPTVGFLVTLAATGTSLKMARFLFLTWPPRSGADPSKYAGVWKPWAAAVVAVVIGFMWLPGTPERLSMFVTPTKFWTAVWPAGLGAALAALAAWRFRGSERSPPVGLPAGDVVVLLERLVLVWRSLRRPGKSQKRLWLFARGRAQLLLRPRFWRGFETHLQDFSLSLLLMLGLLLSFALLGLGAL